MGRPMPLQLLPYGIYLDVHGQTYQIILTTPVSTTLTHNAPAGCSGRIDSPPLYTGRENRSPLLFDTSRRSTGSSHRRICPCVQPRGEAATGAACQPPVGLCRTERHHVGPGGVRGSQRPERPRSKLHRLLADPRWGRSSSRAGTVWPGLAWAW